MVFFIHPIKMTITGIITKIRYRNSKQEVKINDFKNTFWVEFRGALKSVSEVLKVGDSITIECIAKAKESDKNTFNNLIAKKLQRL